MIHSYRSVVPDVRASARMARSADVIGDLEQAEDASAGCGTAMRGAAPFIRVCRGTGIPDYTIAQVDRNGSPTILEDYVRIGRAAPLRSCHVRLNGLVEIGTIVSPGAQVSKGSRLLDAPDRVKRSVTDMDLEFLCRSAKSCVALAAQYRAAAAI